MTDDSTRKPGTLFGSGQHGANRRGRGKTTQRTMAEIVSAPMRHVKDGKVVRRTLDDDRITRLYIDAAKGNRHAMRELLEGLNAEARAAIGRKRLPRQTAQQVQMVAVMTASLREMRAPATAMMTELAAEDVIHKVGSEWFIRPWVVALAQEHRRQCRE